MSAPAAAAPSTSTTTTKRGEAAPVEESTTTPPPPAPTPPPSGLELAEQRVAEAAAALSEAKAAQNAAEREGMTARQRAVHADRGFASTTEGAADLEQQALQARAEQRAAAGRSLDAGRQVKAAEEAHDAARRALEKTKRTARQLYDDMPALRRAADTARRQAAAAAKAAQQTESRLRLADERLRLILGDRPISDVRTSAP